MYCWRLLFFSSLPLVVLPHFFSSKPLFWCNLPLTLRSKYFLDSRPLHCISLSPLQPNCWIFFDFLLFLVFSFSSSLYHCFFFNFLIRPPPRSCFFFGFHWFYAIFLFFLSTNQHIFFIFNCFFFFEILFEHFLFSCLSLVFFGVYILSKAFACTV